MSKPTRMPLRVGISGEPKVGKSFLGASFVKEFDGFVFDFAGVHQTRPDQKSPVDYWVSDAEMGDAYWACESVGIDLEKQYVYIKSWDEFVKAVDKAKEYRPKSQKANKRIWIVMDDTMMWRWHAAINVAEKAHHESIVKTDWGQATTNMTTVERYMESQFNLLFLNQMKDDYAADSEGESINTGNRVPAYFPPSQAYAFDLLGILFKDETKKPHVQHLGIKANRFYWSCKEGYVDDVINPVPKTVMKLENVREELW